jgi:hypothetical protein
MGCQRESASVTLINIVTIRQAYAYIILQDSRVRKVLYPTAKPFVAVTHMLLERRKTVTSRLRRSAFTVYLW